MGNNKKFYLSHAGLDDSQASLRLQKVLLCNCWSKDLKIKNSYCEQLTPTDICGRSHYSVGKLTFLKNNNNNIAVPKAYRLWQPPLQPSCSARSGEFGKSVLDRAHFQHQARSGKKNKQKKMVHTNPLSHKANTPSRRWLRHRKQHYLTLMKLLVVKWILSARRSNSFTPSYQLRRLQKRKDHLTSLFLTNGL